MSRKRSAKRGKRIWPVVVVATMAVQALAHGFAGGTGQPNDPYRIATAAELRSIGSDPNLLSRCFVLAADIDLTGQAFSTAVIARDQGAKADLGSPTQKSALGVPFDGPAFTGCFDGRGYKITGLTIVAGTSEDGLGSPTQNSALGGPFLGLFGCVGDGGQVVNLGLENVKILGGRHARFVGALAGYNSGLICRCYAKGSVSGGDWSEELAGLVGANAGTVSQCYAATDTSVGQHGTVAALLGSNAGVTSQCYAAGSISAGQYSNLAGLVGSNAGVLSQCYTVAAMAKPMFSTRTGLAQSNTGLIRHCYFLSPADGGGPDNGLGTMLSSEQMGQPEQLAGWAFYSADGAARTGAWFIPPTRSGAAGPAQSFPVLVWQTQASGLVWLPQVRSVSLAEAQTMLKEAGLVFGKVVYEFDPVVPADKVIGLDPGYPVAKGTTVDVLVSLGVCDWAQNPGAGTKAKPYEVSSPGQLECLGRDRQLWSKSFVLTADIDLTGRLYSDALIGGYPNEDNLGFSGSFDGGGYYIIGLTMASARDYVGLFGYVSPQGEVRGLTLKDACVLARSTLDTTGGTGALAGVHDGAVVDCSTTGSVTGCRQVGGLVGRKYRGTLSRSFATTSVSGNMRIGGLSGYVVSTSTVSECSAVGEVCGNTMAGGLAGVAYGTISQCFGTGYVSGDTTLGGLVGQAYGVIRQCSATGAVTGKDNLGGLVGYASATSSTSQCAATGAVSGGRNLGGLVGTSDRGSLTECYATGNVTGVEGLGGLVGYANANTVSECYARGQVVGSKDCGGLAGIRQAGEMAASFWDTQTSGLTQSAGGQGLTTAQMRTAATFIDAGWDFVQTWVMCPTSGYPRLQWESVDCSQN